MQGAHHGGRLDSLPVAGRKLLTLQERGDEGRRERVSGTDRIRNLNLRGGKPGDKTLGGMDFTVTGSRCVDDVAQSEAFE